MHLPSASLRRSSLRPAPCASAMYEHRFLENIKNIYKSSGKCENQQKYEAILEAAIVSNSEGCTDNILMIPRQYDPTKQPSTIKLLRQISEAWYVKHKTDVCRLGAPKAKHKEIRAGNTLCSNIVKLRGHTKINQKS